MTKKQKKMGVRILAVLAAFFVLLILEHTGVLAPLPGPVLFVLYFIPYLVIGYDVIRKAFVNISHGQVFDENFLMMLATFAAFGLGLFGDGQYSEALAVMLFYQIGEFFQGYAVGKSRQSIADMMSIAPDFANLEQDGDVEEVDPEDVEPGSILVIRPGEKIPIDGVVIEGSSFLNTAALTGESVPRRVGEGDACISGCVNGDGMLRIRTTKAYEDSTVAKILDLVENAGSRKARLENFITRFARYYTPVVTIAAVALAVLIPLVFHTGIGEGIRRACNFLIVSCPCALVISVPLGFFGGIGAASRIGVLVKGSNFLEMADLVDTVVMDKTGTLTRGEFRVAEVKPAEGITKEELLGTAALAESSSSHPIASSILTAYGKAPDRSLVKDVKETPGKGISACIEGKQVLAGNAALLAEHGVSVAAQASSGTNVYCAADGKYLGNIRIDDVIKENAASAIAAMKEAGIRRTVMLTGDGKEAADAVASALGIDEVKAGLLPQDKVAEVEKLLSDKGGKVCFVGDGINDAPVLVRSDLGIAMGSLGSDAAIEAADIVLMDDDLSKIAAVKRIAGKTLSIVRVNIVFALAVKIGILILSAFGHASMWAAVFADVGVAFLCILNSMRALRAR